jgi:hypothetical protein
MLIGMRGWSVFREFVTRLFMKLGTDEVHVALWVMLPGVMVGSVVGFIKVMLVDGGWPQLDDSFGPAGEELFFLLSILLGVLLITVVASLAMLGGLLVHWLLWLRFIGLMLYGFVLGLGTWLLLQRLWIMSFG